EKGSKEEGGPEEESRPEEESGREEEKEVVSSRFFVTEGLRRRRFVGCTSWTSCSSKAAADAQSVEPVFKNAR
ncbi:MAG TPA: hypothetical protein PK869_07805, partial [Candidatus Hydrogenedentes bacterium]|nr:hypothetical protein [Candidatus Hydrogenedentota bacterium]